MAIHAWIGPACTQASVAGMAQILTFSMLSKNSPPNRGADMATLKIPVTQHDHIRDLARAPVTLVEYGDYECPHCGLAHPIVNALREQFGFKLRFVFRHFPLSQVHPNAEPAAEKAPNLPAHMAASGRCWAYRNPTCAMRSRTGNLRARCEAISWWGTQRRQRYAVILHQWHAPRWILPLRSSASGIDMQLHGHATL